MASFLTFYVGGMLAVMLTIWAEAPALKNTRAHLPPGTSIAKLAAVAGVAILAWPVALVALRVHWEQATKGE